jgi:hypothetical protein
MRKQFPLVAHEQCAVSRLDNSFGLDHLEKLSIMTISAAHLGNSNGKIAVGRITAEIRRSFVMNAFFESLHEFGKDSGHTH